tara:strand:- start:341 stop:613 length:273 start_codon:yes stop_codon:yes gene_type:complete
MNLSRQDEVFIAMAALEAAKSEVLMKHGCVAVVNGKILARGHNDIRRTTSKDNFIKNTCSCHAEIACLRNLYYQVNTNAYGKYTENIKGV